MYVSMVTKAVFNRWVYIKIDRYAKKLMRMCHPEVKYSLQRFAGTHR